MMEIATWDASLIANNILSACVVMMCWWLAHASASSGERRHKLVSFGYGIFGTATLAIAMFRTLVSESPWIAVFGKTALLWLLFTIATSRARTAFMDKSIA